MNAYLYKFKNLNKAKLSLIGILFIVLIFIAIYVNNKSIVAVIVAVFTIFYMWLLSEESFMYKILPLVLFIGITIVQIILSIVQVPLVEIYLMQSEVLNPPPELNLEIQRINRNLSEVSFKNIREIFLIHACANVPLLLVVDTEEMQPDYPFGISMYQELECKFNCTNYELYIKNTGKVPAKKVEILGETDSIDFNFLDTTHKLEVYGPNGYAGNGGFIIKNRAPLLLHEFETTQIQSKNELGFSMTCEVDGKKNSCRIFKGRLRYYPAGEGILHLGHKPVRFPKYNNSIAKSFRLNKDKWEFENMDGWFYLSNENRCAYYKKVLNPFR